MYKPFLIGLFVAAVVLLSGCAVKPKGAYDAAKLPAAPDYAQEAAWAALPFRSDAADYNADPARPDRQSDSPVDVFYLHPTTYTGDRGHNGWNGPIEDAKLIEKTDGSAMAYQASLFNAVGRVYAPRYRQAHIDAYFTKDRASAKQAFEVAYADVRRAFEHYLAQYNEGRPIIIAAHSQGTTHAQRLIQEFFDRDSSLRGQLVVAYIVGIIVKKDAFAQVPPCETPEQTGCFCAWRTYRKGHYPKAHVPGNNIAVTNPLTWAMDTTYAPKSLNQGGLLPKFRIYPNISDAQVNDGLLWVGKPRFRGSFLIRTPNYHAGDFNLFYFNVQENAQQRAEAFLAR